MAPKSRLALFVALAVMPTVVDATEAQAASRKLRAIEPYGPLPPKDCTRLNGRYGYYGNPWCSRHEQLLWDRWEAERIRRWTSRAG
jgi:hypothetical protein